MRLLTHDDPRYDVTLLDLEHGKKGYFGCNFHFIVKTDGVIQIGRHPFETSTISSRPWAQQSIVVGVSGAYCRETKSPLEIQPVQRAALEELYQSLANAIGLPLEIEERIDEQDIKHDEAEQRRQTELDEQMAEAEARDQRNFQ